MSNRDQVDEYGARLKAREIIKRLRIRRPEDISIEDIAWVAGAIVVDGGLRGAEARLVHSPGADKAILRVSTLVSPAGRRRFAIAHELGHLRLTHRAGSATQCSEKEFTAWYVGQKNQEVEANIFASELLMPEELVRRRLARTSPGFDVVDELAAAFQTTLTASAIRYIELCDEPCAAVHSCGGNICWFRANPLFRGWIKVASALSPNTHASDYFSSGVLSPQMDVVRKDAWVEDASDRSTVKEQSRALHRYNSVLTILWAGD